MAQQTINLGTTANDGTGDTLRDAGDKINDNFTELYAATGGGGGRTVSFQILGTAPEAGEPLLAWTPAVGETVTFADDFADSSYKKVSSGTNPASDYAMGVLKNGASVGTITISTTGTVAFATSGAEVEIVGGTDVLEVFGNATPDAGAVGYTFTLKGA